MTRSNIDPVFRIETESEKESLPTKVDLKSMTATAVIGYLCGPETCAKRFHVLVIQNNGNTMKQWKWWVWTLRKWHVHERRARARQAT